MDNQMGGIILIPEPLIYINNVCKVIYELFTLRFFHLDSLSYCLFPNATALDVLLVQYITTVYAFLMIIVVVVIFDRCALNCSRLRKWVKFSTAKNSVVNGMSALLILCYSNCADVSFRLLNFTHLFLEKQVPTDKKYVYLNGEIIYFSKEHLRYAIPALFFLSTVILAPLILFLVCPLLHKLLKWLHLEETRMASVLSCCYLGGRIKPFYDVFLSCFKDQFNFFAGLYFFYQLLALAPQVFGHSGTRNLLVLEVLLVLMLMVHAITQPYNNRMHNIIDALLFSNLVLITALSLANRIGFMYIDVLIDAKLTAAIQSIFISIPIFVLLVAMLGHCVLSCLAKKGKVTPPKPCSPIDPNQYQRIHERKNLMGHRSSRERSLGSFIAREQQNEIHNLS